MRKIMREGVERLVALAERLTRPRLLLRSAAQQAAVAAATRQLSLYHSSLCPYCIKTRRAIARLNLPIALRDAKGDPVHRDALLHGGGKVQVPCLRIDEPGPSRFIYESDSIIAYLSEQYGAARP